MSPEPLGDLIAPGLESRRLALAPLRVQDAAELWRLLSDPSLHRFIGGAPPTPQELQRRLERQVRARSPDGTELWLNWVARERSGGAVLGTMQATISLEQGVRVAVLAWTIGSAHQGQGLATEAAARIASWLREQGITQLRAHIHPRHDASMAVAAAIGLHPTDTVAGGERRWESA
jgi:RimJ/RimL family protein N-acetyltransferase